MLLTHLVSPVLLQIVHGNILSEFKPNKPDLELFVPVSNLTQGTVCQLSGCHINVKFQDYFSHEILNFTERSCTIPGMQA